METILAQVFLQPEAPSWCPELFQAPSPSPPEQGAGGRAFLPPPAQRGSGVVPPCLHPWVRGGLGAVWGGETRAGSWSTSGNCLPALQKGEQGVQDFGHPAVAFPVPWLWFPSLDTTAWPFLSFQQDRAVLKYLAQGSGFWVVLVQRGVLRHCRGHGHPHGAESRAAFASSSSSTGPCLAPWAHFTPPHTSPRSLQPPGASWGAPAPCPQPHTSAPSPSFWARGVRTAEGGQLRAPTSQSLPPWGSSACGGCSGSFGALPRGWLPLLMGGWFSPTGSALRS